MQERLDEFRTQVGQPVVLSSGLRCATWNQEQGGELDSRHLTGRAIDLRCTTPFERRLYLNVLCTWPSEYAPFIEVSPRHVHFDLDWRNPQHEPLLILGAG